MKYGSYQLHPFVAQVMGAHKSTVEKAKEPEVECSDTKNYFHSLSLPPYPREVHVHMMKEACSLKKETIQLSSHIKFPNFPKYREFLVHEPVAMKEIHGQIPLVLCLHGTDETITDTELLVHEDGHTRWLDLSDKENFLLVFPQSLTYEAVNDSPVSWRPEGDQMRSEWAPDHNDEDFISELLHYLNQCYPVDQSRTYCIGFSNGGLFLSSLLLSHNFHSRFAAVCNYMGGLDSAQLKDEACLEPDKIKHHVEQPCYSLSAYGSDLYACFITSTDRAVQPVNTFPHSVSVQVLHKTRDDVIPMYIVTGTSDTNRNYCYTALCTFKEFPNYQVFFDDFKSVKHEYLSISTFDIWKFFKQFKK